MLFKTALFYALVKNGAKCTISGLSKAEGAVRLMEAFMSYPCIFAD